MAMVVENDAQLGFRYSSPVRRRFGPDAPFFASGNIERELLAKQIALDITEDEKQQLENMEDVESRYYWLCVGISSSVVLLFDLLPILFVY